MLLLQISIFSIGQRACEIERVLQANRLVVLGPVVLAADELACADPVLAAGGGEEVVIKGFVHSRQRSQAVNVCDVTADVREEVGGGPCWLHFLTRFV